MTRLNALVSFPGIKKRLRSHIFSDNRAIRMAVAITCVHLCQAQFMYYIKIHKSVSSLEKYNDRIHYLSNDGYVFYLTSHPFCPLTVNTQCQSTQTRQTKFPLLIKNHINENCVYFLRFKFYSVTFLLRNGHCLVY